MAEEEQANRCASLAYSGEGGSREIYGEDGGRKARCRERYGASRRDFIPLPCWGVLVVSPRVRDLWADRVTREANCCNAARYLLRLAISKRAEPPAFEGLLRSVQEIYIYNMVKQA